MASYNGLVASSSLNGSTASQVIGNTGQQIAVVAQSVPAKYFSTGQFAINVSGISGTFGVQVVGSVGGATYVIAGRTNITAAGGFPVPLVAYVGTSGAVQNFGIPRPSSVAFQGAGVGGTTNFLGITASVFLAGEYN